MTDLTRIIKTCTLSIQKEQLEKYYKKCTDKKENFLLINVEDGTFTKNFNEPLN